MHHIERVIYQYFGIRMKELVSFFENAFLWMLKIREEIYIYTNVFYFLVVHFS